MDEMRIEALAAPFTATITPPGSKSLTNRAMVLAALASGDCELANVLFADDTRVMIDGLKQLGFILDVNEARHIVRVHGQAGKIAARDADLFCGNSGTTIRFLTALCGVGQGSYRFDGVPRMRQRPIGPLVQLLANLGVRIEYVGETGFPPLLVHGDGIAGGIGKYGSEQSSQFLSAAIMVAPYARHEVRIDLDGPQTSWPYVAMTMQLMDTFGITAELIRDHRTGLPEHLIIPRGTYHPTAYAIEPDASNASYFLAAAAVHPGAKITVQKLGKRSLQGDVGFADVLHSMGASLIFGSDFITITGPEHLEGIDVDLANMPDTAQTLAVVALFAQGPTTIRGLHTLRVKETDRLAALSTELTKLGAEVEIDGDALTIHPPERGPRPARIATYDDHRMAMSFAIAATKSAGVIIEDPACVTKTYPGFFDDLKRVTQGKSE
jgi:3-phosphoshikimate 1-carboxyvinyltransferase